MRWSARGVAAVAIAALVAACGGASDELATEVVRRGNNVDQSFNPILLVVDRPAIGDQDSSDEIEPSIALNATLWRGGAKLLDRIIQRV